MSGKKSKKDNEFLKDSNSKPEEIISQARVIAETEKISLADALRALEISEMKRQSILSIGASAFSNLGLI